MPASSLIRLLGATLVAAFLPTVVPAATPAPTAAPADDKIVNGLVTAGFPAVLAVLDAETQTVVCTATLVGCQTALTAAHCVCDGSGAECQGPGPDLTPASELVVFAQHGGFANVSGIAVAPGYEFGVTSDVAVLELDRTFEGLAPLPLNDIASPPAGTFGTIAGFGVSRGDRADAGVKRHGQVETALCTAVPEPPHICWNVRAPLGSAGVFSNTCVGDSGGPLLVDLGDGPRVAGVTSGGEADLCLPPDEAWDADVFFDLAYLRAVIGEPASGVCGDLPAVGGEEAPIQVIDGRFGAGAGERVFTLEVPSGAELLRVAVNGVEGPDNDPTNLDLYLRAGLPASPTSFDCGSALDGVYEFCEVRFPEPGAWYGLLENPTGQGFYQVTATVFGGDPTASEGCQPDAVTLCVDDTPGDRRFRVEVDFATSLNGGTSGAGQAIPLASLGVRRGGLFWFFDLTNPELLIKVLDGCAVNGHFWVFWSAGTTVGLEVRVTDTATGRVVRYRDPDGPAAEPVTDTEAFPCN